ncbi:GNAT family N-acetyltransferase [Liquorilactobacillus mali]|uniref:GNAT family N-acetyltransferase n=1 Tax=Liquorilactobacillus mali TaxID=1618 RepID=UPI002954DDBA|nr:GNAT family N-acetyltransferase [Liquorilactobacillus mali]MDV7758642.1 GNAT family N-acetyltransferase [Liquorilactobacillus mali]
MIAFYRTTDVTSKVYQDALSIRKEVFVSEQGVPEKLEIDAEELATHYVGYVENQAVVTARTIEEDDGAWHIQRVAALNSQRHKGYAKELMKCIEEMAVEEKIPYLTLGAQDQAQNFYSKLGFKVVGEGFLDAGIPHHKMNKKL